MKSRALMTRSALCLLILTGLSACCSSTPAPTRLVRTARPHLPPGEPPDRQAELKRFHESLKARWDPPLGVAIPPGERRATVTLAEMWLLGRAYREERNYRLRLERAGGYRTRSP